MTPLRGALFALPFFWGCTPNPCKQLLPADDVAQVLGGSFSDHGSANKGSCSVQLLAAGSPRGYDVKLELKRYPKEVVALNLRDAVSEVRGKGSVVGPLQGFGEEAFVTYVSTDAEAPRQDPGQVVQQMAQRAAIDRADERVKALAGEAGIDAGSFDSTPDELKRAPRNMNEFLARLPPAYHQALFRQGEWTGTLAGHKDAVTVAQFQKLIERVASRTGALK